MLIICPTITAFDNHEYRVQVEQIESFAQRIHIDLMDGKFAPTKSPDLSHVWWPPEIQADIHLMYQRPMECIDRLIELKPSMVIVHAEAELDHAAFAAQLHEAGVKVGIALLRDTTVESVADILKFFDQVLVFSGHLGYHGGEADINLLPKVAEIKTINPTVEIAWDGGISDQNVKQLIAGGVDVLNTGGFIQKSANPADAYAKLKTLVEA